MGHAAVGLPPNLRARGAVVGLGVGRVGILIRVEGTLDLLGQAAGNPVIAVGVLREAVGRGDDNLGPVRLEKVDLLSRNLVGHGADDPVTADGTDHGQPGAGVATGRFDDGAAGLEETGLFCSPNHVDRDPFLHGAGGVQVLHLGHQIARRVQPPESDQRRVSYSFDCTVVYLHEPKG